MEKKTIGQFIAALRKANGMTQKELAEKLNVSDKAVSRWERDESAPDLSLIPVIAEIFGVTSDEILRGERVTAKENLPEERSEKGKKQIALLLEKTKTRFKVLSLISLGIVGVGLIAAMICNLGFLRAHIAFFIGCVFFLAAAVCEGIFLILALSSLKLEEEEEGIADTKAYICRYFANIMIAIVSAFAFCLPLIMDVDDTYWGLNMGPWFTEGVLLAGVTAFIAKVILWIVFSRKEKEFLSSDEAVEKNRLKLRYVKVVAIMMVVTAILQVIFNTVASANHYFAEAIEFDNYEDFVEYMETPVSFLSDGWTIAKEEVMENTANGDGTEIPEYEVNVDEYLENRNDEYELEQLCDENGKVLCEYYRKNEDVAIIDYGKAEDGYLPIKVITQSQLKDGLDFMNNVVTSVFVIIYVLEILSGVAMYYKKRNSKK